MGAGFHLQISGFSQVLLRRNTNSTDKEVKCIGNSYSVNQLQLISSDFKFCALLPHNLIEYVTGSIVFKWVLIDFYLMLWGKHLRVFFKKLHVYMWVCMCMRTHMCAWYECVGACVVGRVQTCKRVISLSSFPWICGLSSGCQACESTFTYRPSQLLWVSSGPKAELKQSVDLT